LTLKTAQAQANNIVARAVSEAEQIKSDALNTGTRTLLDILRINNQIDSTAFSYIASLQKRMDVDLTVSHLSDQNIVKTEAVVV
jgi:F0F1-type ATP synthase membrane subunit b/b'